MNIAVVGHGHVAEFHKNAILKSSSFNFYGAYDINPAHLSNLPEGTIRYQTVDDCLDDPNADIVLLLVPAGSSKQELSIKILTSGKYLFTDKPVTRTGSELSELLQLAKTNESSIYGMFHSRWSVTIRELVRLFAERKYLREDITKINVWAYNPVIANGSVQFKPPEYSSFLDEGPNIIAELLYFIPDIEIVVATRKSFNEEYRDVYTSFTGHHSNIVIKGEINWINCRKEKGIEIVFRDGHTVKAIHTEQKVYFDEKLIFDGVLVDSATPRLQKDYDNLYAGLDTEFEGHFANDSLMAKVATIMDQIEGMIPRHGA